MGKAFTTAVRWLAPLSAILTPGRTRKTRLNDAMLGAQAVNRTPSGCCEAAPQRPETPQNVLGIALQQVSPAAALDAQADRLDTRPTTATPQTHSSPSSPKLRPLRVLRIRENCPNPRQAGRLVISGRMADVCAELERMAAAHPGLVH